MRLLCMPALTALIVITIHVRHVGGEAIVDYKHEDCRYHVHFHPLSWSEAYNVCKGKNQTLLKLDDLAELTKINSIVDSKINKVLSTPLDSVWIGLQATSQGGNLHHFWPDGDQLTTYTSFTPWQSSLDDQKEGCVMFHPSSTYSAVDCSSSLPYICENRDTDPFQCFFSHSQTNDVVRSSFLIASSYENNSNCAEICHGEGSCAGVLQNGATCTMLINSLTAQDPQRGDLYLDTVIDWIQYISIASSVPPSDACSVTSHSTLLTTPTALYASSESSTTSAESTLTTLYPSTTPPFPSSTVTPNTPHLQTSTPHLQTVTGSIHSSPVMSSLSSSSSVYYCSWVSNVTYTPQELQQKIEKMISELTVDKKQTNKYKRSLISVPDSRPSARGIGSSVGVLTLGIVIALLVAFDCPRASRHTLKIVRIAKARFTKRQP